MATTATTKVTATKAFDIDPRALATFPDETTSATATRQFPPRPPATGDTGLRGPDASMLGFDYGQFAAVYRRFESGATGLQARSSGLPRARRPEGRAGDVMPAPGDMATDRTIVLVGLMGAGKSCIGRRLAARLGLPFRDADAEIERAAGCSIEDIFQLHGEAAFREGENRVICRLLTGAPHVLATGGGAFMNPDTRAAIEARAISVWLRADLDLMLKRTSRRNNRPLLKHGDPRKILSDLMAQRYPVYADADLVVDSVDGPPEVTVERVLAALRDRAAAPQEAVPVEEAKA